MPAKVVKLGPGTVSIGEVGTAVDFSCQVTAAHVDWSVDADDPVQVLCGESVPGARSYSSVFAGTLFQDIGDDAGIVAFSWANKGATLPFVFEPSTAEGKSVSGELIVDPLSVGGDEAGANMTSDFEYAIVGDPVLGDSVVVLAADAEPVAEEVAA
jgi:hypothetical protein